MKRGFSAVSLSCFDSFMMGKSEDVNFGNLVDDAFGLEFGHVEPGRDLILHDFRFKDEDVMGNEVKKVKIEMTPKMGVISKEDVKFKVTANTFAAPEFFVKKMGSKNAANVTEITDPDGVWMTAVGGEANTFDISFQMQAFSTGQNVRLDDLNLSSRPVLFKVRLWSILQSKISGKNEVLLDEITSNSEVDRFGNKRSDKNKFYVARGTSEFKVNADGSGCVSIKILTTSQQNNRRKLSIQIIPDFGSVQVDAKFSKESFSYPLEVMSKMNKLNQKRQKNSDLSQMKLCLEKSFDLIKAGVEKKKLRSPEIYEIVNQLASISEFINTTLKERKSVIKYEDANQRPCQDSFDKFLNEELNMIMLH